MGESENYGEVAWKVETQRYDDRREACNGRKHSGTSSTVVGAECKMVECLK